MESSQAAKIQDNNFDQQGRRRKIGWALIVISLTFIECALSQVAAPVFLPGDSQAAVSFNVQVTCATPGASIRYTTNGMIPTINDPLVPIGNLVLIPRSVTLKAMAWSGETTYPAHQYQ